ncbi:CaiB/BaiF CoA transferase family protein [Alteribacter keqinensis]|uniref:CoA transferase n=1 Tax=Alteribacter keqinensis TaxID=2483800 RepID=A0A3M7U0F7_9BACI|nr:CoA transferase [Alteribacter keqinensis]RNA70484.1 CoA transferase [Alteribacter keqinensis]
MLKGIRVIDFSFYLPGPYATLRLGDLGAEVIKVEPPEGDPARNTGEKKNGDGLVFLANNRNKKSITLDLKTEEGQTAALLLIEEADVVIESFRPGVTSRLGIDYERAKEVNPGIVYCSISGYGQAGTASNLGSHDLNYMAVSGSLSQMKDKGGSPVHPTNTFADLFGGVTANERILAALVKKERTGEGEYVDLSLADSMVSLMTNHVIYEQETGRETGISLLDGELVCYSLYETKDGRYAALAALEKKFWTNFCDGVNRPDWISSHWSTTEESNTVFKEIQSLFAGKTLQEWTLFGLEHDCCLTPVLEPSEINKTPYFQGKNLVWDNEDGTRQAATFPQHKSRISTRPPLKGEHTRELLSQMDKNQNT